MNALSNWPDACL